MREKWSSVILLVLQKERHFEEEPFPLVIQQVIKVTDWNDVEKVLKRFNITLRDTPTHFRNMEDVLDEVAQKWKTLDSAEQSQIATATAGEMCAWTYGDIWGIYCLECV